MTAVACVAFSHNRKDILLILRKDVPLWVLPGGGIDEGEKPEAAALREFLEETGISAKKAIFKGIYIPTCSLAEKTYLFEMVLPDTFKLKAQASECLDAQFFPLNALPRRLAPFYKNWIDDALEENKAPFEKPMKNMGWVDFFKIIIKHPILTARFLLAKMGCPINSTDSR